MNTSRTFLPQEWFRANIDEILRVYAESHLVAEEDIFLSMRNQAPSMATLSEERRLT